MEHTKPILIIYSNQPINTTFPFHLLPNTNINQLYKSADTSSADYYLFLDIPKLYEEKVILPDDEIESLLLLSKKEYIGIIELGINIRIYHRSLIHFFYPYPEKYKDVFYKKLFYLEQPFESYKKNTSQQLQNLFVQTSQKKINEFYLYFRNIMKSDINTNISPPQSPQNNEKINFLNKIDVFAFYNLNHPFFQSKIIHFHKHNREMFGQCGTYHFHHDFRNANRNSIINHLIYKFNYQNYLEIGTNNCYHFSDVRAKLKIGVDPSPPSNNSVYQSFKNSIYIMTSAEFFMRLDDDQFFDIIFIDGCLIEENIYNDIICALEHLKPNGTIVIHDCNPPHEFFQRDIYHFDKHYNEKKELVWNGKGYTDKNWNGMTWKTIVRLINERGHELEIMVVDTDWGVGIIRFGKCEKQFGNNIQHTEDIYQYKTLEKYRRDLLNLISVEEFLDKFI